MKNSIAFFSDTDCDIKLEYLKKYNINLINMPVYIDGEEYNYDLEKNPNFVDFYKAMEDKKTATTAAINVQNYVDAFEPFLKKGQDILYVAFSSGLSATFGQLKIAIENLKKDYPNQTIYYVDTLNISIGAALIAIEAAKMLASGAEIKKVLELCNELVKKSTTIFTVEDLGHLKRGGRIGAATAIVGGILNIKPILKVSMDGKLLKFDKCQGMKKSVLYMFDYFVKNYDENSNAIIFITTAQEVVYSQLLKEKIEKYLTGKNKEIVLCSVGPIVGAHCGIGTIGLGFCGK